MYLVPKLHLETSLEVAVFFWIVDLLLLLFDVFNMVDLFLIMLNLML